LSYSVNHNETHIDGKLSKSGHEVNIIILPFSLVFYHF